MSRPLMIGAVLLIILAGGYAALQMLGEDDGDVISIVGNTGGSGDDPSEKSPDEKAAHSSSEESSRTVSSDAVLIALRKTGWSQAGEVNELELSDTIQTSVLFRRHDSSVAVTIFEARSAMRARQLMGTTPSDSQVVRMGSTVVRVKPASGRRKKRAARQMIRILEEVKRSSMAE